MDESGDRVLPEKFRVLLVEDNPHVIEIFGYALKRLLQEMMEHGVEIELLEALDGHQAWKLLESSTEEPDRFGLVVLDLMMPILDGLEVLSLMRAHEALASTPVLVVTAADAATCADALSKGANAVLRKPAQLNQMRAALERVFSTLR